MSEMPNFDRVEDSLYLTTLVLRKADSVFPHQRHEIEKRLKLQHGVFSRLKRGN